MRKTLLALILIVFCGVPAFSQQQLDAATKEDVEQLMQLTGVRERIQQMWASMAQQSTTTAVDAYRDKHPNADPLELRKVAEGTAQYMQDVISAFSVDELLDAIVPLYQQHFTHADLVTIIDFYKSATGQKFITESPALMSESMQAVQPIIKKHLPELEAAAEKAAERSAKARQSDKSPEN
jgi:uncharacterized protein